MGSPGNTEARPSTESTDSYAPLIPNNPPFRPPPHNYVDGDFPSNIKSGRASTNVKLSGIVVVLRVLAAISGLAIGISFVVLGVYQDIVMALTAFVWVAFAWDVWVLAVLVRKPSVRISLVMRDGRAINFVNRDEDDEDSGNGNGRRRRRCGWPRAFWIDLLLLCVVFSLTIVGHVHGWGQWQKTIGLNWFALAFHILITVLTATPKLSSAHVRFERADVPQIALP